MVINRHDYLMLLQTDIEKEFQKRIAFEFDLNTVISSNLRENQHATKRSLLVESKMIFLTKIVFIRSLKNV